VVAHQGLDGGQVSRPATNDARVEHGASFGRELDDIHVLQVKVNLKSRAFEEKYGDGH
jgi:hypothetical protein